MTKSSPGPMALLIAGLKNKVESKGSSDDVSDMLSDLEKDIFPDEKSRPGRSKALKAYIEAVMSRKRESKDG